MERGSEHLTGNYTDTLQVSPLPKLFAGILYNLFDRNVFLLRLPYAILGVLSAALVYLIIKKEYGHFYALLGGMLYVSSRVLFDSTRMLMLEPLLHFFWLLFHFVYYKTFTSANYKNFVFSGLFFALALSSKLTSFILLPFIILGFLYKAKYLKPIYSVAILSKNYAILLATSAVIFSMQYLHQILIYGFITSLLDTLHSLRDVYLTKSDEGKIHVINGVVYTKSPWWTYIYYYYFYNGVLRALMVGIFFATAIFKRNFFTLYWAVFFTLSLVFNQVSGVKNFRYLSSIELPLIFLAISGINFLFSKLKALYTRWIFLAIMLILTLSHFFYLYSLKPTEYLGLFNYFKSETSNFTEFKRLYAFGSIRSLRWYRDQIPNEHMLLFRRDYELLCLEFDTFDYFAFDKEDLLKAPDNFLYNYVASNPNNFENVAVITDMHVYKRVNNLPSQVVCPQSAVE